MNNRFDGLESELSQVLIKYGLEIGEFNLDDEVDVYIDPEGSAPDGKVIRTRSKARLYLKAHFIGLPEPKPTTEELLQNIATELSRLRGSIQTSPAKTEELRQARFSKFKDSLRVIPTDNPLEVKVTSGNVRLVDGTAKNIPDTLLPLHDDNTNWVYIDGDGDIVVSIGLPPTVSKPLAKIRTNDGLIIEIADISN